jgi:hypothetical protein
MYYIRMDDIICFFENYKITETNAQNIIYKIINFITCILNTYEELVEITNLLIKYDINGIISHKIYKIKFYGNRNNVDLLYFIEQIDKLSKRYKIVKNDDKKLSNLILNLQEGNYRIFEHYMEHDLCNIIMDNQLLIANTIIEYDNKHDNAIMLSARIFRFILLESVLLMNSELYGIIRNYSAITRECNSYLDKLFSEIKHLKLLITVKKFSEIKLVYLLDNVDILHSIFILTLSTKCFNNEHIITLLELAEIYRGIIYILYQQYPHYTLKLHEKLESHLSLLNHYMSKIE